VCGVLAGWLNNWAPPERATSREDAKKKEVILHPLLWQGGGIRILPTGNYAILRALELGLMLRKPPAADSWLAILEEHFGRNENSEVWEALADDLRFLWHADRGRTIAFLGRLFDRQPSLLQGVAGLRLLAWIHRWLPDGMVHRCLRGWFEGEWERGRQAAGEFAGLRVLLVPEDTVASGLIEEKLSEAIDDDDSKTSDFLYGVASTMAGVWADEVCREPATAWIERPRSARASAADKVGRLQVPRAIRRSAARGPHPGMFRRRHALGVSSITRRNVFARCAWSAIPQARAIWLSGSAVVSMRCFARSTRSRVRWICGDVLKLSLKARQKWLTERETSWASSSARTGLCRRWRM
jgi:hypothetical protein